MGEWTIAVADLRDLISEWTIAVADLHDLMGEWTVSVADLRDLTLSVLDGRNSLETWRYAGEGSEPPS